MGLFDFFLSEEKLLQRHVRKLTNRDSQPDDREASARWLAERGTPEALLGMLARFDLNLEHQLKDASEKEFVYSLLAAQGDKAIEPLRVWLRQCKQFTLPLRLLADVAGKPAAVTMAYELLEIEKKKDDFKPEKKKGLLVWLSDARGPRHAEVASLFLDDFDEGVRCAAADVIIAQGGDTGRDGLVAALANPREDSNRLRVRLAEVIAQRGWRVDESLAERLPPGFQLRDGRVVSTR